MTDRLEGAAWTALVVIAFATGYEALVAPEVIGLGGLPGHRLTAGVLCWARSRRHPVSSAQRFVKT